MRYITAALKKRNGRFKIVIETPLPNITKKSSSRKCAAAGMYGTSYRMEVNAGHGIMWGGPTGRMVMVLEAQEGRF